VPTGWPAISQGSRFAAELPQTANPRVKGPRCPLRSSLTHTRYQGRGADFEAEITSSDVYTTLVVPALIADVSNDASWRYVEFFIATFSPLAEYPRSCRSHVPRRAIPCSELAQQRHNIIRKRVALVAEESVSVVTGGTAPAQPGDPTNAHLHHWQ
jgi:hypothetical protein